ncbi:hypothetical protein L6452_18572 [Arctium lappa]|uniref:Uncharacterized protein n=1 Tax=Arctium lappa TaxID=4217 RepID=A0ACB9C6P1_ARCLA|nr:hypothetical protein L6452_18572 [Arctium lappa]
MFMRSKYGAPHRAVLSSIPRSASHCWRAIHAQLDFVDNPPRPHISVKEAFNDPNLMDEILMHGNRRGLHILLSTGGNIPHSKSISNLFVQVELVASLWSFFASHLNISISQAQFLEQRLESWWTDTIASQLQACCALALLWAFIEVSSKQDHFEDFLCDGSLHGCHESIGIEYGIFSTLSAIAAEMGQLQNDIQGQQRALNYLLRSVRTLDPPMREARIRAAREQLKSLDRRQQALRAEHQALIVQAVIHGHRGD